MIKPFAIGEKKTFERLVTQEDLAKFESGTVHQVYSTFALARDAEWCCRLFVLEMKEDHEEGIGTFVNVTHRSPALLGQKVVFEAILANQEGNNVICKYAARVGDRIIAEGEQGQKILPKEKIDSIFAAL